MAGATVTRMTVMNVSVWTIGGTAHIANLVNGSIEITTETIQNKAAQDVWAYPVGTVKNWSMNAQLVADTAADAKALMVIAAAASVVTPVTFTATTGSAAYTSGVGILTKCTQNIQDGQTYDITIEGAGPISVA
jgi:hypothetical protein